MSHTLADPATIDTEQDHQQHADKVAFQIAGNIMEGGGQILRNTVALSALLGKAICVDNVRANRKKPGLKPQHLCGIRLVSEMHQAQLIGGNVNSSKITFLPGAFVDAQTEFEADTRTAGSICLLVQVALPCMVFAPRACVATLKGGTNATGAPQVDYFVRVLQPTIKQMGVHFDLEVVRRGYYPAGGGQVKLSCQPIDAAKGILPITMLDRGHVTKVVMRSFVAGKLPKHLLQEMPRIARQAVEPVLHELQPDHPVAFEVESVYETGCRGSGAGIIMVAHTSTGCLIAASGLSARGKRGQDAAREVAQVFEAELRHGGCTDEYLQDQLIVFMALANGKSSVRTGPISLHTRTALHFVGMMTEAKFTVTPETEETNDDGEAMLNLIECDGVAFGVNES